MYDLLKINLSIFKVTITPIPNSIYSPIYRSTTRSENIYVSTHNSQYIDRIIAAIFAYIFYVKQSIYFYVEHRLWLIEQFLDWQ